MTMPRLRFKGFKEEWKKEFARDIFVNISEKNNANERVLSVTQNNGLVYRDNLDIDISYNRNSLKNYKSVHPNNVIISLRSFQGGFEISDKNGIVSPAYTVMDFKQKNYTNESIYFWKTLLKSYEFLQSLKKVTYGIRDGRSISYKDFSSIKLNVTSIEEQSRIGKLFYSIDSQIKLQCKKLELCKYSKESYLQNLFVELNRTIPKLRFNKFADIWKIKKLSDVSNIIIGNSSTANLPILTISASQGFLTQKDRFSKIIAGKELENYTLLKRGDLSYNHGNSKVANYGAVFELDSYDKALVPKVYHSFRTNEFADPKFIEELFKSKIPDRELRKLISSGVRMDGLLNISKTAFFGISIKVPNLNEQIKISKLLNLFDKQIELQQKNLDKLQILKKGYLQKMFD